MEYPRMLRPMQSDPGPWAIVTTLREARGMRQCDLADAAKMSRQSLNDLESGRRIPGADAVRRIAGALGVKPAVIQRIRMFTP